MALSGNNLTGVAVQFATEDQKNAKQLQRCIAIFNIKICYYVVLVISISSECFAMQNSESKMFPGPTRNLTLSDLKRSTSRSLRF